jgi:N-methylhydantoinase A
MASNGDGTVSQDKPELFIGIDIGGTFTDAIIVSSDGRIASGKQRSTLDITSGFFDALGAASTNEDVGDSPEDVLSRAALLVHGSTVATNVAVERRGASVALLTTRGHADSIKMMLGHGYSAGLPPEALTDAAGLSKPEPFVEDQLIFEINERVDVDANVIVELNEDDVRAAGRAALAAGAESIAVCLLWSFRNPAHELRVREVLGEVAPGVSVSLSHELAPRMGEYERAVATVLDAYVAPACRDYLGSLEGSLRERGFRGRFVICQTTGGVVPAEDARARPLYMIGSGPAAGIIGSIAIANERTGESLIATDMGGTSFDVGIIDRGIAVQALSQVIEQFEYFAPAVEVKSIGSGGGSIVSAQGGRLLVGPESAGAEPGPVAYGRGGTLPTVTDCALLLGYLPEEIQGGELRMDKAAAEAAIAAEGAKIGLDAVQTAAGALRVVSNAMADLIRQVTVARGLDPRRFTIVSYGGAGPLLVGAYGRELGVERVVVPYGGIAGVWSAFGAAISDVVRVHQRFVLLSSPFDEGVLGEVMGDIESSIAAEFAEEERASIEVSWFCEMKYVGQINEVLVPVSAEALRSSELLEEAFEQRYKTLYGEAAALKQGAEISLSGLQAHARVATGSRAAVSNALKQSAGATSSGSAAESGSRSVYWEGHGFLDTPTFTGAILSPGSQLSGPAIIEADFSTIVVHPGQDGEVDELGNLLLTFTADSPQVSIGAGATPRMEDHR